MLNYMQTMNVYILVLFIKMESKKQDTLLYTYTYIYIYVVLFYMVFACVFLVKRRDKEIEKLLIGDRTSGKKT